ncbi:hypothetical protein CBS101457_006958 [Exobasidium rhododendri]|nr:hypothetical protein CBS101457_006958 [Exobasidium rhododendri]
MPEPELQDDCLTAEYVDMDFAGGTSSVAPRNESAVAAQLGSLFCGTNPFLMDDFLDGSGPSTMTMTNDTSATPVLRSLPLCLSQDSTAVWTPILIDPEDHRKVTSMICSKLGVHVDVFAHESCISQVGASWEQWELRLRNKKWQRYADVPLHLADLGRFGATAQDGGVGGDEGVEPCPSISPTVSDPQAGLLILDWSNIASNWHPTKSQLEVDHHPYIDVCFPWPSVRERILSTLHLIDEDELCDDLHPERSNEQQSATRSEPAMIVWGSDPTYEMAWEVGESFAQKWWMYFDGV